MMHTYLRVCAPRHAVTEIGKDKIKLETREGDEAAYNL